MAAKKEKTIKKVTEIPNASVKIEVEEKDKEENIANQPEEAKSELSEPPTEETPDSEASSGMSWKKIALTIAIVVPTGFLMFGGFLYFSKNLNLGSLRKEPEKKIEITNLSPTPTVEEVDRKAYEIEVQNGSGIAGEAAKVKELLENEGFKVGDVGNADKSDYTDTVITVNDDISQEYIEELTKVLEGRGPVGDVEKFATGEEGEVLVIVGSDLSASPTPAP